MAGQKESSLIDDVIKLMGYVGRTSALFFIANKAVEGLGTL